MARSADLIDSKVFEAEFFLQKIAEAGTDFFAARCYLSAFASSSRSITFAIQAVLSDEEGFREWYAHVQERMRKDPLARFFKTVRNETQKIGHTPLNAGSSGWRGDGTWETTYWFVDGYEGREDEIPRVDVLTACRTYFTTLLEIIYECYERFDVLSPLSFFSVPNLTAKGMTLEEMEEALGFPRGWTDSPNITEAERHALLRKQSPDTAIDRLFLRYLGKVRSHPDGR